MANTAYLLLEKIESGLINSVFWRDFAKSLAQLHKNTQEHFGWEEDNYIGNLPQNNQSQSTLSADFYIENRLIPQFELAATKGFVFTDLDAFYLRLKERIPQERPALIHGDLWKGNYMVDAFSTPVLIDPAVSYSPREMDLAMMQLFGGFPDEVFTHYARFFPLEKEWESRIPIWQLYYILVHLNLFGSAYYAGVQRIINRFV